MTEFKIEKGVPIPPRTSFNATKYPWREMDVGDSFFVAGKTPRTISGNLHAARKSTGRRFAVRAVEGGIRVWRIE